MKRYRMPPVALLAGLLTLDAATAVAQNASTSDLAKAAQNPVANMISLPLQNNTYFGIGPGDDTANVLNIQPVIPVSVGDWNVINRVIAPIIYLPDLTQGIDVLPEGIDGGSAFGLGDINYSAYLSPSVPGKVIWGVGPSLTLPTATEDELGSEKWSAGPAAVALITPKPWVAGVLVRQLWSFAGDSDRKDVSQFLLQPFVNYNLEEGWYLTSSPVITANWEADSDDRWTVPVGGGVGKLFRVGRQPVNTSLQAYYNVETPAFGPDWTLRFQVQFLFPK
jgi:hypothetical protein